MFVLPAAHLQANISLTTPRPAPRNVEAFHLPESGYHSGAAHPAFAPATGTTGDHSAFTSVFPPSASRARATFYFLGHNRVPDA